MGDSFGGGYSVHRTGLPWGLAGSLSLEATGPTKSVGLGWIHKQARHSGGMTRPDTGLRLSRRMARSLSRALLRHASEFELPMAGFPGLPQCLER